MAPPCNATTSEESTAKQRHAVYLYEAHTFTARRDGLRNDLDACKNGISPMETRLAMNWAWRPTWEADHGASWKGCQKRGAGDCPVPVSYSSPFRSCSSISVSPVCNKAAQWVQAIQSRKCPVPVDGMHLMTVMQRIWRRYLQGVLQRWRILMGALPSPQTPPRARQTRLWQPR